MKFSNWILTEMSMMTDIDMPDEVVVVLKRFSGGHGIVIYYANESTLETTPESGEAGFYNSYPYGMLDMQGGYQDGIWQLGNVHANHGWGPLLYELAIEYATSNGIGMMGDTREMSDEAMGVFTHYLKRQDVIKTKLNKISPRFADQKEMHYYYSIQGMPTIKKMLMSKKLIIK